MTAQTDTGTSKTTMNEDTMTQAIADLVTCANLGAKQGMDSTIDHTGAFPEVVADGGIAHTTSAQAFSALQRYITNVKAEWAWAEDGLISADLLTPESAHRLCNGDLNYRVKRGDNPRTVQGLAYGLMKVRGAVKRTLRAEKNAAAIAAAEASGGAWYAEGVTNKDGVAIKYANATKAWAREHFGADWWKEDKASRLAQAVVQQGQPFDGLSVATQKVRAVQESGPTTTTPAPTSGGATFTGVPTEAAQPVQPVVSTEASVTLSDDIILGMATGAGYGSRGGEVTLEGAKLYLRGKGINC